MINKVSDVYKHNISGFIVGPLLKVIEAVFDLLIPLFMKAIIDLNKYNEPSSIPNTLSRSVAHFIRLFPTASTGLGDALTGGAIILIMGISGYIITMFAQYIAAVTSTKVGYEIRNDLYNKILHLNKSQQQKINPSRLLTSINSDSYQIQQGVLLFIRLIIRIPVILIGSLIFSFILDYRVGLSFLVVVPLIILINVIILRKSSKQYIDIQKNLDDISNDVNETSIGARVIRASNNEQLENVKFNKISENYQNKSIKVNKINALINPLVFAITSLVIIIIIFLLKDNLFNSEQNTLIISTIIAEMAYLSQIFFVTIQLTQTSIDIIKANVSKNRINEILAVKDIENNNQIEINNDNCPLIKFDNVYFSFENNDHYFFKNLSFEINKGETFAIIGGTGSGKTTIVNLLERFYQIDKGTILFKGININDYPLVELRDNISFVSQKSSLFKGTIKDNLLMGKIDASEVEMLEAIKLAQADEFINKYEDKLDHYVNEGGSNFSGGQKQRLSIARALLKKSELLILDDSTSALDLLTDKKIRQSLSNLKDVTKIIISQRVASISHSDHILVLEGGEVVGLGKHDELMKNCPIYEQIYHSQIKGEIDEY